MRRKLSALAGVLAAVAVAAGVGVLGVRALRPDAAGPQDTPPQPAASTATPTTRPVARAAPAAPAPAPSPTLAAPVVPAAARPSSPPLAPKPRTGYDHRHLLVRLRPGISDAAAAAVRRAIGATLVHVLRPQGVEVLRLPRGTSVKAAAARLQRDPRVAFAELNRRVTIAATPNDPFYPGNGAPADEQLWGLDNLGQDAGLADADIDAPEAWHRLGLDAESGAWQAGDFAVGVVDTGVDMTHPDLLGKIVPGCSSALTGTGARTPGCVDDNGHGTHVTGTIAAIGNNGLGIVGVAPQAKVYPCKALDDTGSGYDVDIAACIDDIVANRITDKISVISMSLGSTTSSNTLAAAVTNAWNKGMLVVAAAGNEGTSAVEYPAGYTNAVSVAATDRDDAHAPFSNTNPDVEISAPGVEITSTVPAFVSASGYAIESGTSMATPHVAAVAALIAATTGKTGQALRSALDASVDDLGPRGRDQQFGFGRVNECLALGGACTYRGAAATATPTPPVATATPTPTATPTTSPLPVRPKPFAHRVRPSGYRILSGSVYRGRGRLRRLFANDRSRLEVAARKRGSGYRSDLYANASVAPSARGTVQRVTVDYDGNATPRGARLQLLAYDWASGRWVRVHLTRRAPIADRKVHWSTTTRPWRFVSSKGAVRFRIEATGARPLRTRTDLVRFTITY